MPALFRPLTKLVSAPMLVAALALTIAMSGVAVAAVVITGADIKNGTVTGADVKNGSLAAKDLSAGARGVRAVAAVWGNGASCTVITANSRGFQSACQYDEAGEYTLTLAAGVPATKTYPMCSIGNNSGFNTLYQVSCRAEISGNQVTVQVIRVDETGTAGPELFDASSTIPVVVMLP